MTSRIGIELSRVACRVVELDAGTWGRVSTESRVISFASLLPEGASTAGKLALLRGRRASVVVWGARTDHRQVVVTQGSYERMRVEARSRLRDAGLPTAGTLSDIAPASPRVDGMDRQSVLLASAPGAEVMAALAPLITAGIKIRSVLTPAAALQSLARTRRAEAPSDALEVYVALEETATCIAMVRGSVLLASRDLSWGFLDELSNFSTPRERRDIAVRLTDEISAFVAVCHVDGTPLSQVSVCGGLPELRSMTVALMERLDVEVDALDSLFGMDVTRLPEPADEFREHVAAARVAWAVAADVRPALDLFRHQRRRVSTAYLSRAAVVAGAAAGLGVGWWMQNQWSPANAPPRATMATSSVARATVPVAIRRAASPKGVPSSLVVHEVIPPVPPMARVVSAADALLVKAMTSSPLPSEVAIAASAPVPLPPPIAASGPPVRQSAALVLAGPRNLPVVFERPAPAPAKTVQPPRPAVAASLAAPTAVTSPVVVRSVPVVPVAATVSTAPSTSSAPRRVAQEPALPFEASLGTILFGPDRALAIVDGRIVEAGDEVRGARVVEITGSAVMLRDAQGKLRRLSLSTSR